MRYLIIPKIDEAAREIAAEGGLRTAIRARVLERLRQHRLTDHIRKAVREAVEREASRTRGGRLRERIRVIASPDRHTVATGITVIEADRAGADNIGRDLADALVVPDAPLDLIAPRTSATDVVTAGAAAPPEEALWHLRDIGLTAARKAGFNGTGLGVTAAVLDTGIADVPELAGRVTDARELDLESWQARKLERTKDTHGHGTLVAGLIAGRTVGVAPGASLANVIMVPGAHGTLSGYVLALEWVASQPQIAVVNISAGQKGMRPNMRLMTSILRRVDTLAVIAVGNEGPNETRSPGNYPEVISVGACNAAGGIWTGSGGGRITLDGQTATVPKLVAPGEQVTTCTQSGTYGSWNGTSMAAPIVTGLACLLLERWPDMTVAELEAELVDHAANLGQAAERQGAGRVMLSSRLYPMAAGGDPIS